MFNYDYNANYLCAFSKTGEQFLGDSGIACETNWDYWKNHLGLLSCTSCLGNNAKHDSDILQNDSKILQSLFKLIAYVIQTCCRTHHGQLRIFFEREVLRSEYVYSRKCASSQKSSSSSWTWIYSARCLENEHMMYQTNVLGWGGDWVEWVRYLRFLSETRGWGYHSKSCREL